MHVSATSSTRESFRPAPDNKEVATEYESMAGVERVQSEQRIVLHREMEICESDSAAATGRETPEREENDESDRGGGEAGGGGGNDDEARGENVDEEAKGDGVADNDGEGEEEEEEEEEDDDDDDDDVQVTIGEISSTPAFG